MKKDNYWLFIDMILLHTRNIYRLEFVVLRQHVLYHVDCICIPMGVKCYNSL